LSLALALTALLTNTLGAGAGTALAAGGAGYPIPVAGGSGRAGRLQQIHAVQRAARCRPGHQDGEQCPLDAVRRAVPARRSGQASATGFQINLVLDNSGLRNGSDAGRGPLVVTCGNGGRSTSWPAPPPPPPRPSRVPPQRVLRPRRLQRPLWLQRLWLQRYGSGGLDGYDLSGVEFRRARCGPAARARPGPAARPARRAESAPSRLPRPAAPSQPRNRRPWTSTSAAWSNWRHNTGYGAGFPSGTNSALGYRDSQPALLGPLTPTTTPTATTARTTTPATTRDYDRALDELLAGGFTRGFGSGAVPVFAHNRAGWTGSMAGCRTRTRSDRGVPVGRHPLNPAPGGPTGQPACPVG